MFGRAFLFSFVLSKKALCQIVPLHVISDTIGRWSHDCVYSFVLMFCLLCIKHIEFLQTIYFGQVVEVDGFDYTVFILTFQMPFSPAEITLTNIEIRTWISNAIHVKQWDTILIQALTSAV